jgi:predicted glycosyltransferase
MLQFPYATIAQATDRKEVGLKQVLIIEDEAILARNLAIIMIRAGFDVQVASCAAEARKFLAEGRVDLVCADIALGDGDGIDVVALHRRRHPEVPVVIMTGQDNVANRLRAEKVDATAFLAKPFAMSRFRELVVTLVNESVADHDPDTRAPSVLMYSHDTIGLGHMRRNSAIAAEIVTSMPSASVLMMVGCPTGVVFDLRPGVDFIKLPSLAKVGRDKWRPSSLRVSPGVTRSLRAGILQRSVEAFCPDVLLVDHEPAGIWDELVPVLRSLRESGSKTRVVLGLRDILDDPERTRFQWQDRGLSDLVREHYDDILIYGDERLYPTRESYNLEALAPGRVQYCGYVTSVSPAPAPTPVKRCGIVVSGGGGRDAFPVMDAALAGLRLIKPRQRPEMTLIAGPLMDDELYDILQQRAAQTGASLRRSTPDLPALLRDAALFVSMGGYNSMTEAMAIGCPTLVIPRVGPSSEQRIRAQMLAKRGLVDTLSIEQATPEALARRFRRLRPSLGAWPAALSLDGAATAASFITGILSAQYPDRPVAQLGRLCHA